MTVNDALKIYETKGALADALGVHRWTVGRWGDGPIPMHYQYQLQVLTKGRLVAKQNPAMEA